MAGYTDPSGEPMLSTVQPFTAVRGRLAFIAIAAVLAMLGATALAGAAAPSADAATNFTAQAKKKCKKVKKPAAKKRCIKRTVRQLRAAERRDRGKVGVMTRNLYLGADLGPAIRASSLSAFIEANGEIMRDVDTNNYPVRVKGLAGEIRSKSPDVVGLQEVSLWRTGELGPPKVKPATPPEEFNTRTVKYDYLDLLMKELNKGKKRYRVVHVTTEFDFEGPADFDDDVNGFPDINGRLTMRDVIIVKVGSDIRTRNATGGNYSTIFAPRVGGPSGLDVTVDRGWGSVEVKVRNSPWFKFVNTHLEAFGDDKNKVVDCMTTPAPEFASNPVSIRCSQAKELYETVIAPGDLPVVLTGDINSDDDSVVDVNCPSAANTDGSLVGNNGGQCGDTFAYNALKTNGMVNVSTSDPMSCCLNDDILTADNGSPSDFDHHIDHILTDSPARVKKLNSSVSGLAPVNGYWNSDHAGVYSLLRITP
jgi:endonuclease/exonuclease/phosphatase family metal-dependent hydrolase